MPNKAEFIQALSAKFEGDRRRAATALDAVLDTIYEQVVKEPVTLTGFGKFERREVSARTVRNPATGALLKKKKTARPKFSAGAEFKAIVAGEKKPPKAAAKKAPAKTAARTTTRAAAAKKAPVKRTATKAAAKTTTTRAAAAKKAPAKRAAATKTTTRRAPAKKAR